ncbi:hypothetical protein HBI41_244130 [Parastagonospora nodorum]|nr:hypothetical protein HBI41_244130 [Parastagonospora nodorum]
MVTSCTYGGIAKVHTSPSSLLTVNCFRLGQVVVPRAASVAKTSDRSRNASEGAAVYLEDASFRPTVALLRLRNCSMSTFPSSSVARNIACSSTLRREEQIRQSDAVLTSVAVVK